MAAGTGVVKGLAQEAGSTAMALLENKGRVKYFPARTGALAWASHNQFPVARWALVLAQKDLKKECPHLLFI